MEQLSVRGMKTEILLWTVGVNETRRLSGLEVCSLDGNTFIELSEVFTQNTIPVNQENIVCKEDIKNGLI